MIKIAIIGYGNLGKACEKIACESDDFEIAGIFTRRNPNDMISPFGTAFYAQEDIFKFENRVDVVCICTGSANDVTELGVRLADKFNTVDSFDTHAKMSQYFDEMHKHAKESKHLCFVGIGWDPGLFSLVRALFKGVLKDSSTQTFWGIGVSQGHSEAIRRIDGVLDAKQYTVPKNDALMLARQGKGDWMSDRDKHRRECFVVAKDGADLALIEREIVNMPNYFEPYDTKVHFIDKEQFENEHNAMPHAGVVLCHGEINDTSDSLEFSLKLESNPDFTASVLMAYARANAIMSQSGECGARTILDIPVSSLYSNRAEIIKFV